MKNMDKGLKVPKWVLINRSKIVKRLHWASVVLGYTDVFFVFGAFEVDCGFVKVILLFVLVFLSKQYILIVYNLF